VGGFEIKRIEEVNYFYNPYSIRRDIINTKFYKLKIF